MSGRRQTNAKKRAPAEPVGQTPKDGEVFFFSVFALPSEIPLRIKFVEILFKPTDDDGAIDFEKPEQKIKYKDFEKLVHWIGEATGVVCVRLNSERGVNVDAHRVKKLLQLRSTLYVDLQVRWYQLPSVEFEFAPVADLEAEDLRRVLFFQEDDTAETVVDYLKRLHISIGKKKLVALLEAHQKGRLVRSLCDTTPPVIPDDDW